MLVLRNVFIKLKLFVMLLANVGFEKNFKNFK